MRPAILIDLDGCVAELWETVNKHREHDLLPLLPLPVDFGGSNWSELDRAYVERLFRDPRFYRRQRPVHKAKSVLWTLSHFFDINYITARGVSKDGDVDGQMAAVTKLWLWDWELPEGRTIYTRMERKAEVARAIYGENIAFAIEDNALAAQNYIDAGIFTFVVSYPYNAQIESGEKAFRVHGLDWVLHYLVKVQTLPALWLSQPLPYEGDTGDEYSGDTADYI